MLICSVILFLGFSGCGFGEALPTLYFRISQFFSFYLVVGILSVKVLIHSTLSGGQGGGQETWQGAVSSTVALTVHLHDPFSKFIYLYIFLKKMLALDALSAVLCVILEGLYSRLILSR